MVPLYLLIVDIESQDPNLPEIAFRERISSSLSHLEALQEAFGRYQCDISYHQPGEIDECPGWSARVIVSIPIGRKKEQALGDLCEAIVKLIQIELPELKVTGEFERYVFDD